MINCFILKNFKFIILCIQLQCKFYYLLHKQYTFLPNTVIIYFQHLYIVPLLIFYSATHSFFLSIFPFLLFSVSMRNAPWCEIDLPGAANIWGELYVAHGGGNVSSGSRRCEILMRTFSVETHLHISQLWSIPDARFDALCVFRHISFLFSLDLWVAFLKRELNTYSFLNEQSVEGSKVTVFEFKAYEVR